MSEHDNRCPCGTGETYGDCCGRYLADGRRAPTAEALMRSRYTGFATRAVHYLLATWHPSTRPDLLDLDEAMVWHRLDVVAHRRRRTVGRHRHRRVRRALPARGRVGDRPAGAAARDQPLRARGRSLALRGRRVRRVAVRAAARDVGAGRQDAGMLLADLATTSSALATTRSRLAKRALLVDLLRRTPPQDVGIVSRYLGGQLRQRRTGLGWRSLTSLPSPASEPLADRRGGRRRLRGDVPAGRARVRSSPATPSPQQLFGAATADEQRAAAAAWSPASCGRGRSTRCCWTPSRRPQGCRRRSCGAPRCSRVTPSRSRSPR